MTDHPNSVTTPYLTSPILPSRVPNPRVKSASTIVSGGVSVRTLPRVILEPGPAFRALESWVTAERSAAFEAVG